MGPLGSSFVEWNLVTGSQRRRMQAHEDMIVCMTGDLAVTAAPGAAVAGGDRYFLACTFGGEVALWDYSWRKVSNTLKVGERVGFAEWRHDRILISTHEDHAIVMISVSRSGAKRGAEEFELALERSHLGPFPFGILLEDGLPLVIEQPSPQSGFTLSKCSLGFEKGQESPVIPGQLDIIAHHRDLLVVGVRGRTLHLVSTTSLEIMDTVKVPGHGIIRQVRVRGSRMICPSENGTFYDYALEPQPGQPQLLKARFQGSFQGPKGAIHFFDWLDDHTCVVCNDYQLWAFNPKHHHNAPLVAFHALTCCGIDLHPHSPDEFDLAAGDFSGQVVRWRPHDPEPVERTVVSFPIRSMKWLPSGAALVVGDLEGHIHLWTPTLDIESVWKLEGGVTSIDLGEVGAAPHRVLRLAFGCTSGLASVMELRLDSLALDLQAAAKRTWVAHRAVTNAPHDPNFGSIGLYAEVWSLAWSPCASYLATCSEDQTVAVWGMGQGPVSSVADGGADPEPVAVLRGHTAAVTCVKWKATVMGEVLVSASDDRTMRVWRAGTWEALHTLSTSENPFDIAWHTITYCEIEPGGSRVVCGTSNGYIFCWDLARQAGSRLLFARKMHAGSIEGMCWRAHSAAGLIATCSSDCTVQVFRIGS